MENTNIIPLAVNEIEEVSGGPLWAVPLLIAGFKAGAASGGIATSLKVAAFAAGAAAAYNALDD